MSHNKDTETYESPCPQDVLVPAGRGVYLEHHVPKTDAPTYHLHPSVEVNFLQDCSMTYSFSGTEVHIPERRLCLFWGAHPHGVKKINGKGTITNAYITLSEFLRWSLPIDLVTELLGGSVLVSKSEMPGDLFFADQWAAEVGEYSQEWQRLHATELKSRLLRLAIQGWHSANPGTHGEMNRHISEAAIVKFEKMLRFVALHYADKIGLEEVATAGGVSPNYAISLFKKMLGRTVRNYITELRLFHAKMQLMHSENKILAVALNCGFGSQSAFYQVFQQHTGTSPASFREAARC